MCSLILAIALSSFYYNVSLSFYLSLEFENSLFWTFVLCQDFFFMSDMQFLLASTILCFLKIIILSNISKLILIYCGFFKNSIPFCCPI